MLLVPQLAEAGGSRRLDAAGQVKVADIVAAQPAPVDLISACEDLAAHMKAGTEIDFQIEIGNAFVARALAQTPGQIAEDFAGFGDPELAPGLAKPVPRLKTEQ